MTIKEIENILKNTHPELLPDALALYKDDTRSAVAALVVKYQKVHDNYLAELKRLDQMLTYENREREKGRKIICGIDEAGRGPLAGPVVAAAVVLPEGAKVMYANDSKKLTAKKREELFDEIMRTAVSVGVGIASPARIDEINILQATYEAMREAVSKLSVVPDVSLNDAVTIPKLGIPQVPIIKGDAKSLSIACASIIAKVTRDRMMEAYDTLYPEYGFAGHKGYGSADHYAALKKYGACPIHRRSFRLFEEE
ncbi:MAG: ribonuclease HII [Lachnospiraceae bacterium]|nr:ribonuclease HII [Lachnospiraceae bacterium]